MSVQEFMSKRPADSDLGGGGKKKKAKITKSDDTKAEFEELRARAKAMCTSPEEWKFVLKYKHARLQEWVTEHEFLRDKQAQQSISTGVENVVAMGLDWCLGGKGLVSEQLMTDQAWCASFDEELSGWTKFLSNSARLSFLTASNCARGKQAQMLLKPDAEPDPKETEPVIEEEKEKGPDNGPVLDVGWPPVPEFTREENRGAGDVFQEREEGLPKGDNPGSPARDMLRGEEGEWQDNPVHPEPLP